MDEEQGMCLRPLDMEPLGRMWVWTVRRLPGLCVKRVALRGQVCPAIIGCVVIIEHLSVAKFNMMELLM